MVGTHGDMVNHAKALEVAVDGSRKIVKMPRKPTPPTKRPFMEFAEIHCPNPESNVAYIALTLAIAPPVGPGHRARATRSESRLTD